jgi:hypothetical protein
MTNYKDRSEEEKIALAENICDFINELIDLDKEAIHGLVETRYCCNEKLTNHPTVQVSQRADSDICSVGILGILNGFVGIKSDGWGYIVAHYDDESGRLIKFSADSTIKIASL